MIRKLGIYALTAFGLLGTAAIVCGSPQLERLAHASLVSPVLIVYSERGEQARYRIMSSRFEVAATDIHGRRQSLVMDRASYHKLSRAYNPWSRHIITLPYIASLVLHADPSSNQEMRTAVLRYGFCGSGPMSRAMNMQAPVKTVSVSMVHNDPGLASPPELTIACSK